MFHFRLSIIIVLLMWKKYSLGEELRVQNHDGFGYELIQSKLEGLESRFSGLFDRLTKQVERVEVTQQQFNENAERNITQLMKGMEVLLGNKVSQITDQATSKPQENSSSKDSLENGCSELPKATSGLCMMDIGGNKTEVYQVHSFGSDWLTVLQRSDGSENFDRNWTDYRDGFGTAGEEFWLGLEKMHVLTKTDSYELLFELEDFSGTSKHARYGKFSIGSEQDLYRLSVLGAYSGTAGNSLEFHKGSQFSTLDKGPFVSCVNLYTGGWWYQNCFLSHLTGKWQRINAWKFILWRSFASVEDTPLKFVRMLIRKI